MESLIVLQKLYRETRRSMEGCEIIEYLFHGSRPSISVNDEHIEKVKETVQDRVDIREIAEDLNISNGSTQHFFFGAEYFAKTMSSGGRKRAA